VRIWNPPRDVVESSNVYKFMLERGYKDYKELVKDSVERHKWFWGALPEWLGVEWFREPRETVDLSRGVEWAQWYRGGLVNASYNVLDRVVRLGCGDCEAFTWVGEDGAERRYTYAQLLDEVVRFSRFLDEVGIGRGDVVAIYAPMTPESVVAMLASMRVGAIATPIFSGFAPRAVAERLRLGEAKVLVTGDYYLRRGRRIDLVGRALEALREGGETVKWVVVASRDGRYEPEGDNVVSYNDAVKGKSGSREAEELDPEHPALLLFTSGTTGRPKGAVISHAGALLQPAKEHFFNLDTKPGWEGGQDRLWWITDLGWMMGPWQVIGAQFHGSRHLMVEGAIDYPDRGRVWRIIDEYGVTQFGFAATVARMLKSLTPRPREEYSLGTIRILGNTGEPIDRDTWIWVMEEVGGLRAPMINLSGGTEIFGCILLPSPVVPLKPSTLWGPGLGMDADVFDENGRSVVGQPGYLVVKKPTPSMTRGLWKEPERYIETYWSRYPGVWYHGDLAYIDSDGFWFIIGRADDVIKVAGKRIGPAEIETVLNSHPEVVESACIGAPHPVKGEVIACFVVAKRSLSDDEIESLREMVADALGKPFKPYAILQVEDLPRTRSGKIMRRVIRSLLRGLSPGKPEVMDNPESVEYVKRAVEKLREMLGTG